MALMLYLVLTPMLEALLNRPILHLELIINVCFAFTVVLVLLLVSSCHQIGQQITDLKDLNANHLNGLTFRASLFIHKIINACIRL